MIKNGKEIIVLLNKFVTELTIESVVQVLETLLTNELIDPYEFSYFFLSQANKSVDLLFGDNCLTISLVSTKKSEFEEKPMNRLFVKGNFFSTLKCNLLSICIETFLLIIIPHLCVLRSVIEYILANHVHTE